MPCSRTSISFRSVCDHFSKIRFLKEPILAAEKSSSSTGKTETKTEPAEAKPSPGTQEAGTPPPAASPPPQPAILVDDAQVSACYSNFCRVSSTPEELILDLGLNPNPMHPGEVTVKVSQRIILNHYTAKRLLAALSATLQRHEQTFGVLETDIRRRVRSM
jgi:hypothetical protein